MSLEITFGPSQCNKDDRQACPASKVLALGRRSGVYKVGTIEHSCIIGDGSFATPLPANLVGYSHWLIREKYLNLISEPHYSNYISTLYSKTGQGQVGCRRRCNQIESVNSQ